MQECKTASRCKLISFRNRERLTRILKISLLSENERLISNLWFSRIGSPHLVSLCVIIPKTTLHSCEHTKNGHPSWILQGNLTAKKQVPFNIFTIMCYSCNTEGENVTSTLILHSTQLYTKMINSNLCFRKTSGFFFVFSKVIALSAFGGRGVWRVFRALLKGFLS